MRGAVRRASGEVFSGVLCCSFWGYYAVQKTGIGLTAHCKDTVSVTEFLFYLFYLDYTKKGKTDVVKTEGRLHSIRSCISGAYLLVLSTGWKYRSHENKC